MDLRQTKDSYINELSALHIISICILTLYLVLLGLENQGIQLIVIRPLLAYLLLTIVPGLLLLAIFDIHSSIFSRQIVYVIGVSIVVVMILGGIVNLTLPLVGISQPLSLHPLLFVYTVGVATLVFLIHFNNYSPRLKLERRTLWEKVLKPTPLFFALLPFLTVLSVTAVGATNIPLIAVLVATALMPLIVAIGVTQQEYHAFGIWSIGITLLYHKSLAPFNYYRGHSTVVTSWLQGRWLPNSSPNASLFPTNILHPIYAEFTGVGIITELNIIKPLIVAIIPVAVFGIFKQYVGSRNAFVATALFMFAHPFYFQFVIYTRADMPTLFLVMLVLVATDNDINKLAKRGMGLLFATGIIVSHYGASYYILFAVLMSFALMKMYDIIDSFEVATINGVRISDMTPKRTIQLFSISFVMFYIILAFAWYLYTGEGAKYSAVMSHVASSVQGFVESGLFGSGQTARKLGESYGAVSIALSKRFYLSIALLSGIGIGYAHFHRFFQSGYFNIEDEYLALATAFIGAYGLSFLGGGFWGGGRPLIMSFSIAILLTVYGIISTIGTISRLITNRSSDSKNKVLEVDGSVVISIFLAIFLVLNTGVAAATVTGGYAPTTVPLQSQVVDTDIPRVEHHEYYPQGLEGYVFLRKYIMDSSTVYAGFYSGRYGPAIIAQSHIMGSNYRSSNLRLVEKKRLNSDYIVVEKYITESNTYAVASTGWSSFEPVRRVVANRSKIYSNGGTSIYYAS